MFWVYTKGKMKIIQPSFKILKPLSEAEGIEALRFIERCARVSHKSEEAQTETSYDRFIRAAVLSHGDWSVVEHASASVEFRIPRGVTHELVRHRLFAYTQESTRFVNGRKSYPDGLEFISPQNPKWGELSIPSMLQTFEKCEETYLSLLDFGWKPQECRAVLPNALAATIITTGNLRSWRHLFLMRTSRETHPDFKAVTIPLLAEFQKLFPILYEDIIPEARQIDNLRLPR
jgi:thymidylate synthase (FAD)